MLPAPLRALPGACLRACRTRGWWTGLAAAGALILTGAVGGLRDLEHPLHDAQLRWFGRPPKDAPAHVACFEIDDGTLARTERWPWPRALLAQTIRELDRAGASVVALDLLLDDPQKTEWRPGAAPQDPPVAILHDELLAAAFRDSGKVVLAARVDPEPVWDAAQTFALGELGPDPLLSENDLAARAAAAGVPMASVLDRLPSLKREVLRRKVAAWRAGHPGAGLAACATDLLGAAHRQRVEAQVLAELWHEAEAKDAAARRWPGPGGAGAIGASRLAPPVEVLAQAVWGVGGAPWSPDADGVVRSCLLATRENGGLAPTLPVMAAGLHLGLDPKHLRLSAAHADLPPVLHVPLVSPRLGEHWRPPGPRAFVDWTAPPPARHPLGPITELARLDADARHNDQQADADLLAVAAEPGSKVPLELLGDEGLRAILELVKDDPASADHPDTLSRRADLRRRILAALAAQGRDPGPAWRDATAQAQACRDAAAALREKLRRTCEGRICLIGWTATGSLADFVTTPTGNRVPGMLVQAAMMETLVRGHFPVRAPFAAEAALTGLLALALSAAAWRRSQEASAGLLVLALAGTFLATGLCAGHGLWLDGALPAAAGFAAWLATTLARFARDSAQKRRITAQFRNYVSPSLVDHLVTHPELAEMRNEEREITCVFTDFAGFTAVSAHLDADRTALLLNRYLAAATRAFMAHGGNVNKYMGDGILVFWGAPLANPRQAVDACRALWTCRLALAKLADDPELAGLPPLSLRAGMTTGRVRVGDFGAPPLRSDYTVIGDSVNLASRLESANKQLGTATLVGARAAELAREEFLLRPIARLKVVGRDTAEPVFELRCPRADATEADHAAAARSQGVCDAFGAGDFARCLALANEAQKKEPEAKWPALYRAACEAHLANPALPHDGSLALERK